MSTKVSHCKLSVVVNKIIEWLKSTYKRLFDDGSGAMPISCGKIHEYLGMTMDFSVPGQVKITMIPYVMEIIELFAKHDSSKSTAHTSS